MLNAVTYTPRRRPIGQYQARSRADVAWRLTWPFLISTILACLMILCLLLIGALEIASLAKGTEKLLYGNTSSTGAGLWCGLFFSIAAVLILLINYMPRVRLWATVALIGTIVAACFAVILIGLDAKAVQDGNSLPILLDKTKIISAQLAFAVLELVLCLIIIGIYIAVLILAPKRIRRVPRIPIR